MTDGAPVDAYIQALFATEDDVLRDIRTRSDEAGLPEIQVPALTGRAIQLLLRAAGAARVLEVGALGGYSAVWIARALPANGSLVTIEHHPEHAAVARGSVQAAGVSDRVEIVVGEAKEVLRRLEPPFDAVFLDADKESYVAYLEEAARLLRPGGLLFADNALWRGEVVDPGEDSLAVHVDRFNRALARDSRFEATILPVGDGVAFAVRGG